MLSSPFPGMDPYIENPAGWPDVHHRLLTTISEHLAVAISPNFYVRVEERVYLTDPLEDAGYETFIPDEEIHDYYLEVRDARSHEVVTAIELLSPANKVKGSRGYEAMLEKRKQLCQGGAHWLEIDLLRAGKRPERTAGQSDYCVTLLRRGKPGISVWFVDLRDPLPTVAVPLRTPFEDVPLNLQQVLDEIYRRAYYADSIDYTRPVLPPKLKLADEAWVKRLLTPWLSRS